MKKFFVFLSCLFFDEQHAQGARTAVGGDGAAGQGVMDLAAAGEGKNELLQVFDDGGVHFAGFGDEDVGGADLFAFQHFGDILAVDVFDPAAVFLEDFQLAVPHPQGWL